MQISLRHSGPGYFLLGLKLIWRPDLRVFLLFPIVLNLILFCATFGLLVSSLDQWLDGFMQALPQWMSFLRFIIWPLVAVCVLVIYGYCFNFITTLLGAPLYGLLAQKVQTALGYAAPPDESWSLLIRRTFHREWQKICYFTPRSLLVLALSLVVFFIPVLNLLMPVVVFLWGAWCLAIQFCDYAADNQTTNFSELKRLLSLNKGLSLSFGGSCAGASMVPLLNILAVPAAVAGGTALWLQQEKNVPSAGGLA
jgi:CysZ protein